VVVGLAAVTVRVLYAWLAIPDYAPESDAFQYLDYATNVSEGRGLSSLYPGLELHPTAFRPPLYPLLLGGLLWVTGPSVVAGQALNLLLGVGVAGLAWATARRLGGDAAGLVAGLAVAAYPPLVANDLALLSEPLSLVLLLGTVLALLHRRWAGAAVLTGLLVLTRPSAQFLVVVLGGWVLWRLGWRRALGFAGIALLVVTPWVVRNWVQLGSPLYVTSNGFTLAAVYSAQAQQADRFLDPIAEPEFDGYRLLQLDEVLWNREMQRLGLRGLREDPGYVLDVVGRNTLGYFELTPSRNQTPERLDGRNLDLRRVALPLFYLVTVVGWFGLLARRRDPGVVLLIAVAGYFVVSSLVLVAPPRLRAPFDVISCIGLGLAWAWWSGRRSRPDGQGEQAGDLGPTGPAVRAPGPP
jgi:hypothetical protein